MDDNNKLFSTKLVVLNCGLKLFKKGIEESGGKCINMDWMPPAGGDPDLLKIIKKIKDTESEE